MHTGGVKSIAFQLSGGLVEAKYRGADTWLPSIRSC